MQIFGTFYGYEQRTNVSRYFIIYATDEGLFGGWVSPYDHEEMLARFAGNGMHSHVAGVQSAADSAQKWEEHYNELLPDAARFLEANSENFVFAPFQVSAAISWKLGFTEKSATRFGALDITPHNGKKRRFYLVGRRTPDEVLGLIQKSLPVAVTQAPPQSGNQNLSEEAQTRLLKTAAKSQWPLLIGVGAASMLLSFLVVGQLNFWLPLVACVLAFKILPVVRGTGASLNLHKNTADQLQRDRAAQDARR